MTPPRLPLRTITSCPLCGGHRFQALGEAFDDRYGYPGRFPIAACRSCGLGLMQRQVTPKSLGRLYERYYHQGVAPAGPKRQSRSRLKGLAYFARAHVLRGAELWRWTRPGGSVLDVGAGGGWPTAVLAFLNVDYSGLEWNPHDCERLRAQGLNAIQGDLNSALKLKRRFDTVAMSQWIEHVPDPLKSLRQAAGLLAPGGKLLISCPNWDSAFRKGLAWLNTHVPYHLWHFNSKTLARAAETAGLRVLRLRSISPLSWLAWKESVIRAEEGKLNPDFGRPLSLAKMLAHWPEAARADWQRRGDCLVAELE